MLRERGQAEIHIKQDPDRAGHSHCHLLVEGLDELLAGVRTLGAEVRQEPRIQSWGMRDAVLAGPDGNTIEIAERVAERV